MEENHDSNSEIHSDTDESLDIGPEEKGNNVSTKIRKPSYNENHEEAPKAKRARLPLFTEVVLTGPKGLIQIKENFPIKLRKCERGKEAQWLNRLMSMYKDWGFQLYPHLSFETLMMRIERFGSKEIVRGQLSIMREIERDRIIESRYGKDVVEIVRSRKLASCAMKRNRQGQKGNEEILANAYESQPSRYELGSDNDIFNEAEKTAENGLNQISKEIMTEREDTCTSNITNKRIMSLQLSDESEFDEAAEELAQYEIAVGVDV